MSFDDFLVNIFRKKLEDLSLNMSKTGNGKPVILYTTLLDEENEFGEQELAIINENFVVIQVISFWGLCSNSGSSSASFHIRRIFLVAF